MAPAAIQSRVIEPAMVRIGELWETRAIGVADEHLATTICSRALIRLFETMTATRARPRSRERVLLAAVERQQHVLGLRMIADVLEAAGFDVLFLGADVPVESLLSFVVRSRPAVVGLAYGMSNAIDCLADSLCLIHEAAPDTRIMLGGRAVPDALVVGAYPVVSSSMDVIDAIEALLATPPQPLPPVIDVLRSDGTRGSRMPEPAEDTDPIAASLAKAAEQAGDVARQHVRRAESYRELAYVDPLTELGNRRAFEETLSAFVAGRADSGALMIVDVDALRAVNDAHGHAAGDGLLRAVAWAVRGAVRDGDAVGRVGGDEFAVLLPGATAPVARAVGERIRAALADEDPSVTVSVGVTALAGDARGSRLAADAALYEAKLAGGDRVVVAATG